MDQLDYSQPPTLPLPNRAHPYSMVDVNEGSNDPTMHINLLATTALQQAQFSGPLPPNQFPGQYSSEGSGAGSSQLSLGGDTYTLSKESNAESISSIATIVGPTSTDTGERATDMADENSNNDRGNDFNITLQWAQNSQTPVVPPQPLSISSSPSPPSQNPAAPTKCQGRPGQINGSTNDIVMQFQTSERASERLVTRETAARRKRRTSDSVQAAEPEDAQSSGMINRNGKRTRGKAAAYGPRSKMQRKHPTANIAYQFNPVDMAAVLPQNFGSNIPDPYGGFYFAPGGPRPDQSEIQLEPEIQNTRCGSVKYKNDNFARCVSCIRKKDDVCRFRGVRFFFRDMERNVKGISFLNHQERESMALRFPRIFNSHLTMETIRRLKLPIVKGLLPMLKDEQIHIRQAYIIRRPRETEVRVTCDTCMTSIFSSVWMCRLCGREACAQCFKHVKDLTYPSRALDVNGNKIQHSNPTFLSCYKKNEHRFKDFSPVSRFCVEELDEIVNEMEAFLAGSGSPEAKPPLQNTTPRTKAHVQIPNGSEVTDGNINAPASVVTEKSTAPKGSEDDRIQLSGVSTTPSQEVDESQTPPPTIETGTGLTEVPTESMEDLTVSQESPSSERILGKSTGASNGHVQLQPPIPEERQASQSDPSVVLPIPVTGRVGDPVDPANIPHPPFYIFGPNIQDDEFHAVWSKGQTLIVSDLLQKFEVKWNPSYFIDIYGHNDCVLVECHGDENRRVFVENFFVEFGAYETREKHCWKLKDWPPASDFKTTFPELFNDFQKAVPVPNYTRRDGTLNIAAYFPTNMIVPDLGPKMYNAFVSREDPGSKGTTRLHMDMADAVNIMLYAAPRPDGGDGVAAWDIYQADDAQKIRNFLRKHFVEARGIDPIHSQLFYLDSELRSKLHKEYGVVAHRIYQRPGDAVFIPAGCAHQVVNLADCIKVACDFVSPENAQRCFTLTRQFREENYIKAWKEDVLQLSSMMWFCWLNLRNIERNVLRGTIDEEEAEEETS